MEKKNPPQHSSSKAIAVVCILILSTCIVYFPSLKVPFLLDDYGKIIRNPDIKSLDNIPSKLVYPYGPSFNFHRNDPSRPLTFLTLTLNYHFSQLEYRGYHVVNLLLHAIVVVLAFVLGLLLFSVLGINGVLLPFLSALLFAVHPINVNAVTYIMGGRPSNLAALFYLLAVVLFIQARRGTIKWGIPASAVCFVFALASNQLALTLPAVIFLVDFCFFTDKKYHWVYWGIFAGYLALRFAYFGTLGDVEASNQFYSRKEYFLTQWVALWKYVGMVFWPSRLSFEHLYGPLQQFFDPKVLIATVLYGILFTVIIRGLKSSRQTTRFMLFGVLWFLITISPTSSIFPTTATLAENRVYLPVIGLCLLIPYAARNFNQAAVLSLFGICAIGLGTITYRRNIQYQDVIRIWSEVIQQYPSHQRAFKNRGIEYVRRGQFNQGVEDLKQAQALNPNDFDTQNNLAAAYYNLKLYKDALVIYEEMIKLKPDFVPAYSNIGMVYEQLSNPAKAIWAYESAIRLNPTLIEPLNNLAGIYLDQGRIQEAKKLYEAALGIDPHNEAILKNYSLVSSRKF